jgi:hypothetical protein
MVTTGQREWQEARAAAASARAFAQFAGTARAPPPPSLRRGVTPGGAQRAEVIGALLARPTGLEIGGATRAGSGASAFMRFGALKPPADPPPPPPAKARVSMVRNAALLPHAGLRELPAASPLAFAPLGPDNKPVPPHVEHSARLLALAAPRPRSGEAAAAAAALAKERGASAAPPFLTR